MKIEEFTRQVHLWSGVHSRVQRFLHHLYKCLNKYQNRTVHPNVLKELIDAILKIQQKAFMHEPSLDQEYNYSMMIYIELDTSLSHAHMKLADLMVVESSTNKFLEYVLPRPSTVPQYPSPNQAINYTVSHN